MWLIVGRSHLSYSQSTNGNTLEGSISEEYGLQRVRESFRGAWKINSIHNGQKALRGRRLFPFSCREASDSVSRGYQWPLLDDAESKKLEVFVEYDQVL
jgi:hypothetical protein